MVHKIQKNNAHFLNPFVIKHLGQLIIFRGFLIFFMLTSK